MQETPLNLSIENLSCKSCFTTVTTEEAFCNNCGYPLHGTEDAQQEFLNKREISQIDFEAHEKQIKDAGKTLFWIAGLTFLGELISLAVNKDNANPGIVLGVGAFMAVIFIGLGFWSRKKPTAAIITGLCVYLFIHLLAAIGDPLTLVQGVIVKIVIIGYLIKGIKSSLEADKLIKENNFTT